MSNNNTTVYAYLTISRDETNAPADLVEVINSWSAAQYHGIGNILEPSPEAAIASELKWGTPEEEVRNGRMLRITVEEVNMDGTDMAGVAA